jgi:hypothetical protein
MGRFPPNTWNSLQAQRAQNLLLCNASVGFPQEGPHPRNRHALDGCNVESSESSLLLSFKRFVGLYDSAHEPPASSDFDQLRQASHRAGLLDRHTPEDINALRAAFAAGWPGAPMTWALSWREDSRPNYQTGRRLVSEFYDQYADGDRSISYPCYPSARPTLRPDGLAGRRPCPDAVNTSRAGRLNESTPRHLIIGQPQIHEGSST